MQRFRSLILGARSDASGLLMLPVRSIPARTAHFSQCSERYSRPIALNHAPATGSVQLRSYRLVTVDLRLRVRTCTIESGSKRVKTGLAINLRSW